MPDTRPVPDSPAADAFARLDELRRPAPDLEALQAKFQALAIETHPDRTHGGGETGQAAANDRFATLNAAYACLRDPKARLAHLLELESGGKPPDVQRIPPGTIHLFTEVGAACRAVDGLLAGREQEPSPMRRLQYFEGSLEWTERVEVLRNTIRARQEALLEELRGLNAAWQVAPPTGDPARRAALPLRRLGELSQLLGYFTRWIAQLDERLTRLAL